MRRIVMATTCLLVSCISADADADEMISAWTVGIGQYSCATWLSDEAHERDGAAWVWGFWSGENVRNEANRNVGKTTDGPGIIAVIKEECKKDLSQGLGYTASIVYQDFFRRAK